MDGPTRKASAGGAPAAEVQERPRASAVVAVVTMLVVALVGAGGVLVWARLAADRPPVAQDDVVDGAPPTMLADGSALGEVPAAVAAAVPAPVVAVGVLDALPAGVESCPADMGPIDDPTVHQVAVTPEGLIATIVGTSDEVWTEDGEDQQQEAVVALLTSQATWTRGGWEVGSAGMGPLAGAGPAVSWGGAEGEVQTASATVRPPDGTAWVVQERGGYRLAYPAAGAAPVSVLSSFRAGPLRDEVPPPISLTYLAADGTWLGEEVLRA